MNRREFLQHGAAAVGGLSSLAAAGPDRPNILFIMPDQWRGMDLGSMGNAQVRTPNLDRLAREGVQFTGAVANCAVCTPARGTLLTGKYAHTIGVAVNDVPLPSDQATIAKILRDAGYYTGFIGKWHLEGGKRLPGFVPPGPRRQGFEFWAANICSHDYFHQQYFRDDPAPIKMPDYETFTWTDLAVEFLDKAKSKAKPFCLYLQYAPPHDPYLAPPGFENMYDPEKIELRKNWEAGAKRFGTKKELAGYYSAIACLDQEIGRLLSKVPGNTIVVFTSDHGDMHGSHGTFLKRKPWEESVRVPAIFHWTKGVQGGRRLDVPFSHVDVVPTLLGLCGVRSPVAMHGVDHSSVLRGKTQKTPEFSHLMSYTVTELDEFGVWRGLRSRQYKYARFEKKPWLLYDLEHDPFEMNNLVDDPARQKLIARLDKEIEAQMSRTGDTWKVLEDQPYR